VGLSHDPRGWLTACQKLAKGKPGDLRVRSACYSRSCAVWFPRLYRSSVSLEVELKIREQVYVCVVLLFGALFAPVTANATPYQILWTLNDVNFGADDLVTGTFTYNSILGITALDISTSEFGSFSVADVAGQDLNLSAGTDPFVHTLLLEHDFGLNTDVPSQLADNPLFGGSDEYFIFGPFELNLDADPFLSGVLSQLSTTPLPAALPLFAGGLGLIGLFGRRRNRKKTDTALEAA
jgi:hypothetical protein